MSTYLDEKLARPELVYGVRARAKFFHLLGRWGCRLSKETKKAPEYVEVEGQLGAVVEVWRRVDQSTGKDAMYELEQERPND